MHAWSALVRRLFFRDRTGPTAALRGRVRRRFRVSIERLEARETPTGDIRIVTYNIHNAGGDQTLSSSLGTVLQAIGTESTAGVSRPIDVLAIQEVSTQATTSQGVVNQLNAIYGAGIYAHGSLNGSANSAFDTVGLVYNTQSVQLLSEVGIGVPSVSGQPRQAIRYKLRPVGLDSSSDFYLYNSHYKSSDQPTDVARRLVEAQAIRADSDTLGNALILYAGDFNTQSSDEPGFQTILAAGAGQAFDPLNRLGSWHLTSSFRDIMTQAPSQNPPSGFTGGGLDDRFDFLLQSSEWADDVGMEFRPGSYHTFGNNGSVPLNGEIDDPGNTALPGLANRTTILSLLTTVSDHLPVVADYHFLITQTPTTLGLGDVAFTGYQSTAPDKISLVLLKDVAAGTVLSLTDITWNGSVLSSGEGTSVITFGVGIAAGTQLNYDAGRTDGSRWAVGVSAVGLSDVTSSSFALNSAGDNLFAYNGATPPAAGNSPLWVAAFATNPFLTSGSATASLTYLPSAFTLGDTAISLNITDGANNENGAQTVPSSVTGSAAQVRAAVNAPGNWTTFTGAGGQAVPPAITYTVTSSPAPVLSVSSLVATSTGFEIQFSQPLATSDLNLYDQGGLLGSPDVTLVGATVGAVRGSLIVNAAGDRATFVKTGAVLANDTYTITLRSAANGFRSVAAGFLDGNADGIAGGNYVASFTQSAVEAAVTVGVPDFARGYGQAVDVWNFAQSAAYEGIPILLSTGAGVCAVDFSVHYDPALLTIDRVKLGSAVAGGTSMAFDIPTPGTINITVSNAGSLASSAGPITLVSLMRGEGGPLVPSTAPYGAKQVIDVGALHVFENSLLTSEIPSLDNDGVHIAAYPGDLSGNGTYNSPDASFAQQFVLNQATFGLAAYQLADPLLLGDINANGSAQGNDTSQVQKLILNQAIPFAPARPTGVAAPSAGLDPKLFLTASAASLRAGDTFTVAVNMLVTEPRGITFGGADVGITYDPSVFTVVGVAAGSFAAGFASLADFHTPGVIAFTSSTASNSAIVHRLNTSGTILTATFVVNAGARSGSTLINLTDTAAGVQTALFDGTVLRNNLVIRPAVTDGDDVGVDATVRIVAAATRTGFATRVTTVAGRTPALFAPLLSSDTPSPAFVPIVIALPPRPILPTPARIIATLPRPLVVRFESAVERTRTSGDGSLVLTASTR